MRPRSLFSQIFNVLLFGWTLWIYLPNLKFVALLVPEILGGTQKIWAVPRYAYAPFPPKFLKGFCSDGPCEYTCQILSSYSFTPSWDNRVLKNLGRPSMRPRSLFSKIFHGLVFGWTLWMYLPNLKFVALPIPEIIGGTPKIWGVPGFAHAPYSPTFLKGFCSYGPSEYICQIWSS